MPNELMLKTLDHIEVGMDGSGEVVVRAYHNIAGASWMALRNYYKLTTCPVSLDCLMASSSFVRVRALSRETMYSSLPYKVLAI